MDVPARCIESLRCRPPLREVVITPAGTEVDAAPRAAFDVPVERTNRLPHSARDTLSELLTGLSADAEGRLPRQP